MNIRTYANNIEQKLLILAIVFLPIVQFRVSLPIAGQILSNLFFLLGIGISLFKVITGKDKLDKREVFLCYYLLVFFVWQCLCSIIGVLEYEHYHLINLEQMDKLRYLLQSFHSFGIDIGDLTAIKVWLCLRALKTCVVRIFLTYGISVWIFHVDKFVKDDSTKIKTIFSSVIYAVSILYTVIVSYSIFEVGYLRGNPLCTEIMININPFLYEPQKGSGWWPPLLWDNQLRSLFPEPSYFGIFSALIVPILFYQILKSNTFTTLIVYGVFVTMIFMTQARTSVILFVIQVFLLCMYVICQNRCYIKLFYKIFFVSILSFVISIYMISGFKPVSSNYSSILNHNINNNNQFAVTQYIEGNITSVVGNKRSNSARYAITKAAFLAGIDHPFFGVGSLLASAYVKDYLTREDIENYEIKYNWLNYMYKEGALKFNLPIPNQLSYEMVHFGILGLIIYLLPVFYIFFELLKVFNRQMSLEIACTSIAYIGSVVSFFSNVAFLPYYILTGLIVILLHDAKGKKYYEL